MRVSGTVRNVGYTFVRPAEAGRRDGADTDAEEARSRLRTPR
jgi:hypothetical protein